MTHNTLRIAVLLGGASHEKEISLESGRNIAYKLAALNYHVTTLFVSQRHTLHALTPAQLVYNSTQEIAASLLPEQAVRWHDLPQKADFVFIALHGGLGENGGVQGMLEMLGLPYNGSGVLASALCMDKYKTTHYLRAQDFAVPYNYLITLHAWQTNQQQTVAHITSTFAFPCIVKPHDDGCSFMVRKINHASELESALQALFDTGKKAVLVEEFIVGMELTVGVVGNTAAHALPPSQTIVSGSILTIEEKFLPGAGENQTPAPLPAEAQTLVQRTIAQAYTAIGCKGYARIDCFYQAASESSTNVERVVIIEVNTLPGMTPATCLFHQAAEIGMRPAEFVNLIVQLGLAEHGKPQADTQEFIERMTQRAHTVHA